MNNIYKINLSMNVVYHFKHAVLIRCDIRLILIEGLSNEQKTVNFTKNFEGIPLGLI